jgi:hypothetical protein
MRPTGISVLFCRKGSNIFDARTAEQILRLIRLIAITPGGILFSEYGAFTQINTAAVTIEQNTQMLYLWVYSTAYDLLKGQGMLGEIEHVTAAVDIVELVKNKLTAEEE